MNLETKIDERLWQAIRENYENSRYTATILDSVYFLNDLIRDRTGLESDGVSLIGQAFGGKQPKLKVNILQTESDWNIQEGMEQILRGIMKAIRNPRSHEKYNDKVTDADSIVIFVNWLVGIIDQSKTQFSESSFLKQVFDSSFVENNRYGILLAEQVPARKRLDVMIKVYRQKQGDFKKIKYFVHAMLERMKDDEIGELYKVISEELSSTDDDKPIYTLMQAFPMEYWSRLDDIPRMRAENMIIKSIRNGDFNASQNKCIKGALGTWADERATYFLLKQEIADACITKLSSSNKYEQDYVFKYLFVEITRLIDKPDYTLRNVIKLGLKKGDKRFYDALSSLVAFEFDEADKLGHPWIMPFAEEFKNFKETVDTQDDMDQSEDIPF
jgi:uncharacterized protein (TIGR02391 family)